MSKKVISLLLIFILCICLPIQCLAMEGEYKEKTLEETVEEVKQMYPGCIVEVDDKDTINVLVLDPIIETRSSSIYAPNGGSYRGFKPPQYVVGTGSAVPYSMIYLPAEQTAALLAAKTKSGLFEDILLWIGSNSAKKVVSLVSAKYGILLSELGVLFLVGLGSYQVINWVDSAILANAVSKSSRISITRTTVNGWPSNVYGVWSGNYVTASPYQDWNPTFYAGAYDF